ncbi:hypothetical protein E1B28_010780 [Marasmius oreades]|uniref:F-box domain-containing protein n=1 Tax=Marasmius oreades TaxID=181124 RepID=A0A9P7RSV2_9AGAR|nr:uncharacterized protein E1B28_010780 [Marasmius oreades]KAG7089070.1 hypothetical protein E1B28_010780 [Marasmius oreades]
MSSPMNRLPPEVLGQIFSALRAPIDLLRSPEQSSNPISTLPTVCSQWRETVLSLQILWSWLVLEYRPMDERLWDEEQGERICRMTETILTRARSAPLTIQFYSRGDNDEYPPNLGRVLNALCRRSGQWVELHFSSFSLSFLRHPEFRVAKGNLGDLSHLYLDVDEDGSLDVFTDCPALRTIVLCGDSLCLEMNIPWQQIQKTFVCVDPGLQIPFLRLMTRCSNLNSLKLRLISTGASGAEVVGHNISTNIETLTLLSHHSSAACNKLLFQRLAFPKLSSLQISPSRLSRYRRRLDIAPLLDQLTRNPSPITSLSLKRVHLSDEQRLRLLELVPGLETLDIAEAYGSGSNTKNKVQKNLSWTSRFLDELLINDDLPQGIADPSPSPPLLPKLRNLILRVHQHDIDFDKLYEVARSRCSDAADSTSDRWKGLRSLEIISYREGDPNTGVLLEEQISLEHGVERLESLKDIGLEFSLRDAPGPQ